MQRIEVHGTTLVVKDEEVDEVWVMEDGVEVGDPEVLVGIADGVGVVRGVGVGVRVADGVDAGGPEELAIGVTKGTEVLADTMTRGVAIVTRAAATVQLDGVPEQT